MNMQSLMAQAQKMQRDLMKKKEEINNQTFVGKSELVEVVFNGKKELVSIKIDKEKKYEADDLEILEDMLSIAIKDALTKVDKEVDEKMGAAAGPLNGLF